MTTKIIFSQQVRREDIIVNNGACKKIQDNLIVADTGEETFVLRRGACLRAKVESDSFGNDVFFYEHSEIYTDQWNKHILQEGDRVKGSRLGLREISAIERSGHRERRG